MKPIFLAFVLLIQVALSSTPREALNSYKKAIQSGDLDKALELQTKNKKLPANLQHEEREISKRNLERGPDGWDFDILAEHTEGEYAVIAINESKKEGRATFDLDPVFLVKQDGDWKIVENKETFLKSEADKKAVLDKLQLWFKGFEQGVLWQRGIKK